ncbi:hypothetical protein TRIP_C20548 [Candidatus Zixiibacteriota bacterium]|nr:hypothetical protein TRIP_C20548 [candidate division Zixibacteria bacterium]
MVPDVLVWGKSDSAELHFLTVCEIENQTRVGYGQRLLGGERQDILFIDLVDFRGNHLPATINNPKVIVQSRSREAAFLPGGESSTGFRIARDSASPGPVRVDLFIYELG